MIFTHLSKHTIEPKHTWLILYNNLSLHKETSQTTLQSIITPAYNIKPDIQMLSQYPYIKMHLTTLKPGNYHS